jgi:predicted ATPase/DNA-binding winged helix-turn-helix (wHTH) protein
MSATEFRFGPHALRPHTRTLETDGEVVSLGARAYDVLLALVERRERVVGKDELLAAAWPDTVVEENNLHVQINALRKALGAKAIATVPGRGYQFALPVEAIAPPAGSNAGETAEDAAHGLFGRDDDLRTLAALSRTHAVVTIAGPGGVGKTALARALLASGSADATPVWVELAAVRDAGHVAAALATALDVRLPAGDPLPALVAALGSRRMLIVLDNAEHVVDGAGPLCAAIAAKARRARVVVTSQVPVGIHGEHVHRLAPLHPEAAVALFAARASASDRRFVLGEGNAASIDAICRQLDGMPLAIELAAARVREIGVATLRESLAERLRMIATRARTGPARQQSLRAALEWSYGLLDADERALFRRLGVFAGGFTLPLALAVAGDGEGDWTTVDRLAALAERSLVAVSAEEPPRYSLPETMRAFALEELEAAGDAEPTRMRHARALLGFFSRARADLPAAQSRDTHRELVNARDAFHWAREHDHALAVELATHASRFTIWSARRPEALSWLASCEPLVDDSMPRSVRANWWVEFARFRLFNRHPGATDAARRALALFREERDDRGILLALSAVVRSQYQRTDETRAALAEMDALAARHPEWPPSLRYVIAGTHGSHATMEPDDYAAALRYRKEEAAFAAAAGNVHARNAAETNLIALLRAQEQYDEVRERANALLSRLRGTSETANVAYASLHLLDALIATGRLSEARSCAIEAWHACRAMSLPLATDPSALLAALDGRVRAAARLAGYARALYARLDFQMHWVTNDYLARIDAVLRKTLRADEIARLGGEGAQWSDDEAFGEAFRDADPDAA